MTNPNLTQLLLIADCSGSMRSIAEDMNGGLKTTLDEQAALDGELVVDIVTFESKVLYEQFEIAPEDVRFPVIVPRGMTALLDGIGIGVSKLGQTLADKPEDERPSKVIVVVITDGLENSSTEWTNDSVKELVKTQEEKYGWDFIFLGANIDSIAVGGGFGISSQSVANYTADASGAEFVTRSMSSYLSARRSGDAESTLVDLNRLVTSK